MTDTDLYEAYGRIDERLKNIEDGVKLFNANRKCDTNTEKIRTIERIVWTAMGTAIAAIFKAFWPTGGH